MTGEELIASFVIEAPFIRDDQESDFYVTKNRLVERELAARGSAVKEVVAKYTEDHRSLYNGPSGEVISIAAVCKNLLKRLELIEAGKNPEQSWSYVFDQ